MLSDYAMMIFAAIIIAATSVVMTALAVQFMQWLLEIGEFLQRVPIRRADRFAISEATTLMPAREMAGN
ncbi:MAG TPA: hypothetical protein VK828_09010 [Terriglobales bacterium]|jgi:hypothetical protein|nr:hypothetical protein [Terriglobales bacterium]